MLKRIAGAIKKRLPSRHAKAKVEELVLGLRPFEKMHVLSEPALTITCDDGDLRDIGIVEVLNKAGVKGTFAVSPDLIGRPGFMNYQQLREIRDAGHEIAFHGTTHDPFIDFRDGSQLQAVSREGLDRLAAEGFVDVQTVIYPFGLHDRNVRASMAPIFKCGFTTWFGLNQGVVNRYAIRRIPYGAFVGKLPGTEDWYRGLIQQTARSGGWPTLMLHPGSDGHEPSHDAMLERLIAFSRDQEVPVRSVIAHLDRVCDPGQVADASVRAFQE